MQSRSRPTDPRASAWPSRRAVLAWLLFVGYLFSLNGLAAVKYWRDLPTIASLSPQPPIPPSPPEEPPPPPPEESRPPPPEEPQPPPPVEDPRVLPANVSGRVAIIVVCTTELKIGANGAAEVLAEIESIQRHYADQLMGGAVLLLPASGRVPLLWKTPAEVPEDATAFGKREIEVAFGASFQAMEELVKRRADSTMPFTTVLVWLSEANLDEDDQQQVKLPEGVSSLYLAWAGLESERGSERLHIALGSDRILTLGQSPKAGSLANFVGYVLRHPEP